ncbi:YiiX/YebB-like N1pC/P60 family cysteine hydrolase [Aeromonas eucrenophila]|uniref:YiiX/YebB-like N1pC/P60 family cysteine hydrolase n=1 Tax=Aeromonas eucrenophila TaxID=649 RepID=A0ABW0YAU6_9GAMM|nr:YiiX/YebB-like N1pC/P60 family cysteine hydrolase [Aeromonas eucrenophila]
MFESGDLIFTQIGPPDNAISAVTKGYGGARVNHMGVVVLNNYGTYVLEAFPPEVRVTNLAVHLRRSEFEPGKPRYIHARLRDEHKALIPSAISYGLEKRGMPYDVIYLTDELALYCSELVVDMFKHANGGVAFFPEKPMSFRDLKTGEISPSWVDYYETFGMKVPEGEPGSNPGDISRDIQLNILSVVGVITGYKEP